MTIVRFEFDPICAKKADANEMPTTLPLPSADALARTPL